MFAISSLGRRLYAALRQSGEACGRHGRLVPALIPLIDLIWPRMMRLLRRIDRLTLQWEADRLPAPRAKRPTASRPPAPPPAVKTPSGFGWLNRLIPGAHIGAGHLSWLLEDPESEVRALVAAAPQAGRLFRPLCHILGVTPPAWLALPKRPRKPRPPRPPRPESRTALLRRFRTMTDAELAAWFHPLPPHANLPIPGYQKIRKRISAFLAAGGVRPYS
jgi:hypothetical protein